MIVTDPPKRKPCKTSGSQDATNGWSLGAADTHCAWRVIYGSPRSRLSFATVLSVLLHAMLYFGLRTDIQEGAHRNSRGWQPAQSAHIVASFKATTHAASDSASPASDASSEVDLKQEAPSFYAQEALTRKTELLTPVEFDALFPNGVAPAAPVKVRLYITTEGSVARIDLDPEALRAQLGPALETIERWIFVPGEIKGRPVASIVEIEFSPASGLPLPSAER